MYKCGTYFDITIVKSVGKLSKLTGRNCGTNPCAFTTSEMRIALKSANKNCISLSIVFVFYDEHSNPLNNPSSVYGTRPLNKLYHFTVISCNNFVQLNQTLSTKFARALRAHNKTRPKRQNVQTKLLLLWLYDMQLNRHNRQFPPHS